MLCGANTNGRLQGRCRNAVPCNEHQTIKQETGSFGYLEEATEPVRSPIKWPNHQTMKENTCTCPLKDRTYQSVGGKGFKSFCSGNCKRIDNHPVTDCKPAWTETYEELAHAYQEGVQPINNEDFGIGYWKAIEFSESFLASQIEKATLKGHRDGLLEAKCDCEAHRTMIEEKAKEEEREKIIASFNLDIKKRISSPDSSNCVINLVAHPNEE